MRRIFYFLIAAGLASAADDFPIVPDDVDVALFAREPLVRNPCGLAFDNQGRLCVGMGPQYRKPKPNTPGDSVWILLDTDNDSVADDRKEFATGFNAIQSLAWRGDTLWVANAPDLTVVRDLDGDDEADEYVRLYTDLGNLEHGLHGLNWSPDGKLYMSKGNSKGLNNAPDRLAPKPFLDLWGMKAPEGSPEFPTPVTFRKGEYKKNYHKPSDDWGLSGGVLRCDPDGSNLEIIARGHRNPFDISFDDGFDWLGTDNDQNYGDKIFSPFYGAHFGWGHTWSYAWEGNDHWPSAPSAGPLFEGSGTGVIYLGLDHYPDNYRGVFLVSDWIKRQIYIYRPKWDGAWMKPSSENFEIFAHAERGRTMGSSDGRSFDPVDTEVGPDGAIYISSWGREYGAVVENGQQQNEGRIYKFRPKAAKPISWEQVRDPWKDLASHLPVWRTNAQEALVNQGLPAAKRLKTLATDRGSSKAVQTWSAWTLGRIAPDNRAIDNWFVSALQHDALNLRLQSIRILAHRAQQRGDNRLPEEIAGLLDDSEARIRCEAVLALRQAKDPSQITPLLDLAAKETGRITYYATWGAMTDLMSVDERKELLRDKRVGVRRAALLSLLEQDALVDSEVKVMNTDSDATIASLASQWLGGKTKTRIKGAPLKDESLTTASTLLSPTGKTPTVDEVLPLLAEAKVARGRELFLNTKGATCATCHQMEGVGNAFAPDLSDIGTRADARFIIRAILEPSAEITEGFAMQIVKTKDGGSTGGIVLEETGRALTFGQVGGSQETVLKSNITSRETAEISAMPPLGALMSPQQVADITAYLIATKSPKESWGDPKKGWHLESDGARLAIRLDGAEVLSYYFKHEETKRPFFAHVKTPTGIQVTRNFPPIEGKDPTDHGYMHPGLSLGFSNISGVNFWHNNRGGVVVSDGIVEAPVVTETSASFTVKNRYLAEDGSKVCEETASYHLSKNDDGYLIRMENAFRSDKAITFGVKEEMGMALRVASPIRVKKGKGGIASASGGVNEKGTWGEIDQWWDYYGPLKERSVGLQIMSGEGNPPMWSHSRDYGLLVANPFPVDKKENREKTTVIEPGKTFQLRFGVQVHGTADRESYDPKAAYQRYLAQP
ncbi:MAG: PmoA family protein [Verrucomicrobiales bacterium]|jgi:putative membrane-bound dehydrogenase-like protein|nr:PmoA family protein [Verrucomicrobiales bacterium]